MDQVVEDQRHRPVGQVVASVVDEHQGIAVRPVEAGRQVDGHLAVPAEPGVDPLILERSGGSSLVDLGEVGDLVAKAPAHRVGAEGIGGGDAD